MIEMELCFGVKWFCCLCALTYVLLNVHCSDLSSNLLSSSIEDLRGSFRELSELYLLNVSSNRVRFLSSPMFAGLDHITHLDLTHNNITSIANNTFDQLPHLVDLRMDRYDPAFISEYSVYD